MRAAWGNNLLREMYTTFVLVNTYLLSTVCVTSNYGNVRVLVSEIKLISFYANAIHRLAVFKLHEPFRRA